MQELVPLSVVVSVLEEELRSVCQVKASGHPVDGRRCARRSRSKGPVRQHVLARRLMQPHLQRLKEHVAERERAALLEKWRGDEVLDGFVKEARQLEVRCHAMEREWREAESAQQELIVKLGAERRRSELLQRDSVAAERRAAQRLLLARLDKHKLRLGMALRQTFEAWLRSMQLSRVAAAKEQENVLKAKVRQHALTTVAERLSDPPRWCKVLLDRWRDFASLLQRERRSAQLGVLRTRCATAEVNLASVATLVQAAEEAKGKSAPLTKGFYAWLGLLAVRRSGAVKEAKLLKLLKLLPSRVIAPALSAWVHYAQTQRSEREAHWRAKALQAQRECGQGRLLAQAARDAWAVARTSLARWHQLAQEASLARLAEQAPASLPAALQLIGRRRFLAGRLTRRSREMVQVMAGWRAVLHSATHRNRWLCLAGRSVWKQLLLASGFNALRCFSMWRSLCARAAASDKSKQDVAG